MLSPPPPHVPAVVVASSASRYLLAPALSDRMVAWLTFPASRAAGLDAAYRRAGDQLAVAGPHGRGAKLVYDGGCAAGGACDTVSAASITRDRAVFEVAEQGTAYLASSTPTAGASVLLAGGEAGQGSPAAFSAAAGEGVWALDGAIVSRPADGTQPLTKLVDARETGGRLWQVSRAATWTAWIGRTVEGHQIVSEQADGGQPIALYVELDPDWHLGSMRLLPDGRVVLVRLFEHGDARRAELVLLQQSSTARMLALSSVVHGRAYAPTVSVDGEIAVFRRRRGSGRRAADELVAFDLQRRRRVVLVRERLRDARLSDAAVAGGRVAWASTAVRAGRFAGSRIELAPLRFRGSRAIP